MVKVDLQGAQEFFDAAGPDYAAAAQAHRLLEDRSGAGSELTGWLDLPQRMAAGELKQILSAAHKIQKLGQVLLVVGIGGSSLGARAAVELLCADCPRDGAAEVLFLGNTLSPDAINDCVARLGERDFCVNVVSKSGGTLESALGFRVARALLEQKYGRAGMKKRIFVTTDAASGVLHDIAAVEGYETLAVPGDVGGRFSVLSAVGLLPMAAAGIDIEALVRCAVQELHDLDLRSPENPAWQYAAARQHLYRQGKYIELLACYEPSFGAFAGWWKQLFGESEGKGGIGIFPASVEYSADLHSLGQFVQEGPRVFLETVVSFDFARSARSVPFEMGDPDGLNYLAGRDFSAIQSTAMQAVTAAHIAGGVPNIGISVPRRDEAGLAALICFFEMSCAISAYMSGVNPFDQPGVEAYKQNLHRMLRQDG